MEQDVKGTQESVPGGKGGGDKGGDGAFGVDEIIFAGVKMNTTTAQTLLQGINLLLILFLAYRVERIKAGISKDLEIHRVQFGREFHVYRYLWEKIAHLNRALNAYTDPLNQTPQEELLSNLRKQYFEVNETILNNEPFIKKDIIEQCKALLNEASVQVRYVQDNGVLEQGMTKKFESSVEFAKNSIRKYIRNEP